RGVLDLDRRDHAGGEVIASGQVVAVDHAGSSEGDHAAGAVGDAVLFDVRCDLIENGAGGESVGGGLRRIADAHAGDRRQPAAVGMRILVVVVGADLDDAHGAVVHGDVDRAAVDVLPPVFVGTASDEVGVALDGLVHPVDGRPHL